MNNIDEELVLAHFIISDDVERSRRFYTEILGGGPTDDKPAATLETPRDPDRVSSAHWPSSTSAEES